jgi:hypothetical protein
MTEFIQLVLIASAWIWGVFAAFDEGNIFWGARKVCEATFGTNLCKPFICCPYCMASIHGGLIGLYWFGFDIVIIPFVFCVCGVNFVIKELIYG